MAIPSWNELTELASKYGKEESEQEARIRQRTLLAQSAGELLKALIGGAKRTEYAGSVSPTGEITQFNQPVSRYAEGTGLLGAFLQKRQAPITGVPLTQEQLSEVQARKAIAYEPTLTEQFKNVPEGLPKELVPYGALTSKRFGEVAPYLSTLERGKTAKDIANIRAKALRESTGLKIRALDQLLPKSVSDLIYTNSGIDSTNQPQLTTRTASPLLRERSIGESSFWREMGIDIALEKDILGQVEPQKKEEIRKTIEERKQKTSNIFQGGSLQEKAKRFLRSQGAPETQANIDAVIQRGLVK